MVRAAFDAAHLLFPAPTGRDRAVGEDGKIYQFDTEGIVMNPGERTWDVAGMQRSQ
ncbi:hypothetical protein ACWEQL_37665 [Kitasatospora sp. NPDC004240]